MGRMVSRTSTKKDFNPAAVSADRSILSSRPFASIEEEDIAPAAATSPTLQTQPDRPASSSFNFVTMPLYAPGAAPSGHGTVQRQGVGDEGEEEALQLKGIQAKLTIGQPNDKYEQEADRVASRVVNQINTPHPAPIQREENLENEAAVQMPLVQREAMPEEEEALQRMPLQRVAGGAGMAASSDLETSIAQARGGGQPLAQPIRAPIEQAMGADFSGVKVHTDAQADRLNRSVQAKAFTTGQDVFFRQGEYNPGSRGGQELIAHELTHVVQQGGDKKNRSLSNSAQQIGAIPIQCQFIGELGTRLRDLNTTILGLDNTLFSKFRNDLKGHQQPIAVVHGDAQYDPITKTIYFPRKLLNDLDEIKNKTLKSDKTSEKQDKQIVSNHVATITHELSHARDHIINGKKMSETKNVMETELRAWSMEAVTAHQIWQKEGKNFDLDPKKASLINGWHEIDPDKVLETYDLRDKNELYSRIWRYLERELKTTNGAVVKGWVNSDDGSFKSWLKKFADFVKKSSTKVG